ncbi:hypothetical protein L6466_13195 [Prevotella communis]|uniref:hypothetical protein n=1 Tax=Prevotella communis TaxID=2913614 RepID=UPI001EDA67AD|nr:hypothetical protein [Prevotella communis]UKK67604.1 hypothetical protein L6464_13475 [Prevotella communis]UKK70250.1 hypothetical protein L6466_13195 [Prevotella communis]
MKNVLKIFFSWQSSSKTDKLNNKEFILSCINKAVNEIQGKGDLKDVVFEVKQGTGGEPGTPDMIATCLKRNDECHIFIADISVDKKFNNIQKWVNQKPDLRERPNENVMYELGRADGHLDSKQVIHVANTVFGNVSKNDYLRPIDIRHKRRPITFCLTANNAPNLEKVEKELVDDLKGAIRKSAKAALKHIHEEFLPYEDCEQVAEELGFQKKFIFNENLINIKQAISDNNGILRILGLNGVGKTRLVLETILAETTEVPKLYCDCLLASNDRVVKTTTSIFEKQISAILILDNCDNNLFEKILKTYKRKNAKNRVYAIFEDVAEKRIDTDYYVSIFECAYEDVVDAIIANLYGKQDEVSVQIKELASGNPYMAVQAIDGVIKSGDIRDFNNEKLIANLLSAYEGSDERIIAETLSLFSNLGYEGDAHKEIEVIARNKNITGLNGDDTVIINKFDNLIRQYLERRLMQRVGVYVRFRSPAITRLLTNEWFAKCSATQLENIILTLGKVGMAGNLIPPFFEMISNLEGNNRVKGLFEEMLKPGRLLTQKEIINTRVGSKIYRSLVEIVPDAICDSLYESLCVLGLEELKKLREGRREIVWTLTKLCYKPETFSKAAKLLLLLGCSEVEHVSNNATGQFSSLFPVRLPSTSVSLADRLSFLRSEYNSVETKPVIMKSIDRALRTTDFIHYGGEVTIGKQKYPFYEPRNEGEDEEYIKGCLDLLEQEIDGDTLYKEECIKMLATNFRALNSFDMFDIIMPRVEKVAAMLNYQWDDLLKVLHYARRDEETQNNEQHLQRIEKLINALTKNDFVSRFARVENYESNDYWGMSEDEHRKVVDEKYEALAEEMAEKKLYDSETLKGIYNSLTFLPQAFATKLATLNTPEEQIQFASESIDVLEGRANSIFVYYVKEVDEDVFAKIVLLTYEKGKQWLLFSLIAIRNYPFDHPYMDRLFELVEQGVVAKDYFITFWSFSRIDRLSTPEAVGFLERVLKLPDSFEMVLHMVMSQYLGGYEKHPELDSLFESEMIIRADAVSTLISNNHYSHIVITLLSNNRREDLAKVVAKGIFNYIITSGETSVKYEVERALQVLFDKYFDIAWLEMSSLMSAEEDERNFVKFYFIFGFSSIRNQFPAIIFRNENLPKLMEWCRQHVEVGPYRLMALAPLLGDNGLSEPVLSLIDDYGSDKMVRTALSDKLGTFAGPVTIYDSRVKLIEPLTKHQNRDVSSWAELEIRHLQNCRDRSKKFEESIMLPGRLPNSNWTLNDEEE